MHSTEDTRALAQEVLDYIHANPEKHDQKHFFTEQDSTGCGTTMCIAGTASWLHYGENVFLHPNHSREGQMLLGLTVAEAEVLFYEMSNERAVQKLKKIVTGEGFSKEDFYVCSSSNDTPVLDVCSYEQWAAQDE